MEILILFAVFFAACLVVVAGFIAAYFIARRYIERKLSDTTATAVRCQDCMYARNNESNQYTRLYYPNGYVICECEDAIGDEPMIYPPDHFCGFGKRKDGGGE